MSRSKKKNRLARLLDEFEIVRTEKLGYRGRTKLYVCWDLKRDHYVAVLHKKEDAMFRDGLPLNEAAKTGSLCWMLDTTIIPVLDSKYKVEIVYFYQDTTEDIYVSRLSDWLDETKRYRPKNPNAMSFDRHSISVRHMSVRHMTRSPGRPSLLVK